MIFGIPSGQTKNQTKAQRLRQFNLAASVALFLIVLVIVFFERGETDFRVDARTGTAGIIAAADSPVWPSELVFLPSVQPCDFDGFRPAEGANIGLGKKSGAPFIVSVTGKADPGEIAESAGTIYCVGGSEFAAPSYVSAQIDLVRIDPAASNGSRADKPDALAAQGQAIAYRFGDDDLSTHPPTLRFKGQLEIGISSDEIDPTPAMLESGELVMETNSTFASFGRVESRYPLDKGDRLSFQNADAKPAISTGLISLDRQGDEPRGFRIVARTFAGAASVLPGGFDDSESIAIAPNLIERTQAGAQGIFLGLLGALLLHILSLWTALVENRAQDELPGGQDKKQGGE